MRGESHWPARLLSYLMVGVTSIVGIACWVMGREALLTIMRTSGLRPWTVSAVDRFGFILFGLLWLMLVYLSAHFYSKAVDEGRLLRVFLLIVGGEAGFLVLSIVIRYVLIWAYTGMLPPV
jgi:hypothetical protein